MKRIFPLILIVTLGCAEDPATIQALATEDASTLDDAALADDASTGDDTPEPGDTADPEDTGVPEDTFRPPPPEQLGGDRPATYYVPQDYAHDQAWPLVVLLHGYGAGGLVQDLFLRLSTKVTERGFLLLTPDGTLNSQGKRFWNATDACCDFENTGVDDVAYITGLVDEAQVYWNVDPARVYLIGHSNGGFMSYRLACDEGQRFAALVSLAGGMILDPADCAAPAPVAVAQVHGTEDTAVRLGGEEDYPPAADAVAFWAQRNGCEDGPAVTTALDLDASVAGAETEISAWSDCESGLDAQLWTIQGGGHVPDFSDGRFADAALDFMLSRSRPAPTR